VRCPAPPQHTPTPLILTYMARENRAPTVGIHATTVSRLSFGHNHCVNTTPPTLYTRTTQALPTIHFHPTEKNKLTSRSSTAMSVSCALSISKLSASMVSSRASAWSASASEGSASATNFSNSASCVWWWWWWGGDTGRQNRGQWTGAQEVSARGQG
jgi:hypothetical protein